MTFFRVFSRFFGFLGSKSGQKSAKTGVLGPHFGPYFGPPLETALGRIRPKVPLKQGPKTDRFWEGSKWGSKRGHFFVKNRHFLSKIVIFRVFRYIAGSKNRPLFWTPFL